MTWHDVGRDIVDKLSIGVMIAVVTWFINTTLERHKIRLAYHRGLAERTLQAYWEMGGILQVQAFQIQQFIQAVTRFLEKRSHAEFQEVQKAWSVLTHSYLSDQPKLLQNLMFVSKDVANRLGEHQRLVRDFRTMANPLKEADVENVKSFTDKMAGSLARVQSQMMNEIRHPTFHAEKLKAPSQPDPQPR